MNKSISISNPTKVLSLIVEPVGNGDKIGGNLDLKIFTNATEIKVAALDIEDLGELPANLITFDASRNKIGNLNNFNLGTDVRTFNLKTNSLSALDIDKVLSQFDSNTLVDVGSLIDISGIGNSLVDDANRTKIADLQNQNWTVNYNNYAYTMRANSTTVEEGAIVAVEINTTAYNVKDGTEVPYTITGIQANDIVEPLQSNFIVTNNRASINFNINTDVGIPAYEESESFTITLDPSIGNISTTIPVIDTTPSPFALTSASSSKEGQTFLITISTVDCDVPDGTIVPYTISGTIDANDIQEPLTGSFVINNNTNTIPISIIADSDVEGTEVLTLSLDDYPTSTTLNVFDVTYDLKSTSDDPSDSSFAYGGATEITSIDEGGSFYVVLKTEGLVSGSVPYVISGISASDITEPLTGNFTISNNIGHKTFNVSEDYQTDAGETFTLTLVNGFASTAVTIGDTSTDPTLTLTRTPTTVISEGDTVTIKLETDLPENHVVNYTLSNTIQAADFTASGFDGGAAPADLKGSFTIDANGEDTATFELAQDATTEGTETLTLTLDDYSSKTISVDISDTSLTPTFALSTTESTSGSPLLPTVNEGVSFDITLTTQNIADGTNIPYTITGIQSTDITGSLTGNFTISSGSATETITVTNDTLTEGEEILKLKLDSYSEEIEIRISDTSTTLFALSNDVNNLADEGDEVEFTLTTSAASGSYTYALAGSELNGTSLTVDDFVSGTGLTTSLTGTFTGDGDTVKYKLKEDNITEGTLTMIMTLDDVDSDGTDEAQSVVVINDTSIETYALSGTTAVGEIENTSCTITLTTLGVPDNTAVPFTITGTDITTADFVGLASLSGNFTVNNNTADVTFTIAADGVNENTTETFTLALDNGAATHNVDITDTTFTLQTDATSVNEGQSFTITLNTFGGLADGTEVPYTVSGTDITTADFEGQASASLTGNFTIGADGTATKLFTVANDLTTETDPETFILTLDDYGISQTVSIVDTSQDPTFVLTSDKSAISETGGDGTGDYFTATLTTTGVPDNTLFPYTISGSGVTTDDFDELLNNPETTLDRNYSSVYGHTGIYYNNGITHDRSPQGQSQLDYELGSWAPTEIDSRNYTTVIDFGDTEATLDVSAMQNSQDRQVTGTPYRASMNNNSGTDVDPIIITLNDHTLSTGDEVRMTINADFVGPIAEGSTYRTTLSANVTEVQTESILLGVITQTTTNTFTVQLYHTGGVYLTPASRDTIQYRQNSGVPTVNQGFYKDTAELPLGTDQTAIPFDGVRLEKFEEKQSLGSWMKIYTYGQEVTGLITQGRTLDMRNYDNMPTQQALGRGYVTSYRVQYRNSLAHDGITEADWIAAGNYETGSSISGQGHRWFDVDGGRIFAGHGTADAATEYMTGAARIADHDEEARRKVTNTFNTPVVATEIKIIPVTYYRWPSMRAAAVADVSLSGRSFRVFNNEARKSFKIREDLTTEGTESITFTLNDLRSQSPDNTFTISVSDDSLDAEEMPLSILNIGAQRMIPIRTNAQAEDIDTIEEYTSTDYTIDPTTLDNKLDSGNYDVVMIDGVNWADGLIYPNATTMTKLKDFVTNGGTIMSMSEHSSSYAYVHPHPASYNSNVAQSFPCQIIYDLGGIIGANGGWKMLTAGTSSTVAMARPEALAIDAVNTTTGITSVLAENIIEPRSNGITLLSFRGYITNSDGSQTYTYSQYGPAHMWDGDINGHLNPGVKGKIIFLGDSQLRGYSSSKYNEFKNNLITPLLDYISRARLVD